MMTVPAGLDWRCFGAGNGLTWTAPAWLQPGVGKTMLAVGLSIAACQAGYSVCFTSLHDVVRSLSEAEGAGRFAKNLQTYLKPALTEGNMVLRLVSRRYECGSIVLTSNKTFGRDGPGFR